MLDKNNLKTLFDNKDYVQVYNVLKEEYNQMVLLFAKNHGIEETNMSKLLLTISKEYPDTSFYCSKISNFLFYYEDDLLEKLDEMLDYYNVINKNLVWDSVLWFNT